MKDWLDNLETREFNTLLLGIILASVLLLYQFVWEPVHQQQLRMTERVQEQQELLAWLKQSATVLRASPGQATDNVRDRDKSLLSVVDKTSKLSKLSSTVKRIQPDGEARVRVWLENSGFDQLIGWLQRMENQYAVLVDDINIDKGAATGQVNARVVLTR